MSDKKPIVTARYDVICHRTTVMDLVVSPFRAKILDSGINRMHGLFKFEVTTNDLELVERTLTNSPEVISFHQTECSGNLAVPTVHLNGTSKADLESQYLTALEMINAAYGVVRLAYPNQRDYYVHPDGDAAFALAKKQHIERLEKLAEMSGEFEKILSKIQEQ